MDTTKYKLYTKGGDKGKTSLVGGKRVPKYHVRIESYGTIDELNSFIGQLLAFELEQVDREVLVWIQHKLFSVGSYLATDPTQTDIRVESQISLEAIERLEKEIDRLSDLVPPIQAFILPSGGMLPATAHVCRTICRRAERCIYRLNAEENSLVEPLVLKYINRLSDYFFAFARKESYRLNGKEITWEYEHD